MNREQLLASLQISIDDNRGVYFDDGRYLDWSSDTDDGVCLELGQGSDATNIEITWAEMERLQRALTLMLLNRPS